MMKTCCLMLAMLFFGATITPNADAQQQQQLIVRDTLGLAHLNGVCVILGCNVVRGLGDPSGQVYLVAPLNLLNLDGLLSTLPIQLGIIDVQVDQLVNLEAPALSSIPAELDNPLPVDYYGSWAWSGYLNQSANQIVRTSQAQSKYGVSGAGIVAIIDTGVDTSHPALANVLLPGYDFTRNSSGADEVGDLDHSTVAVLDGGGGSPVFVSPALAAVLTEAGVGALSNPQYAAFGHGTMTAGLVHLVAPTTKILPLKAFSSSGSGYLSDVVRAIYYATSQGSNIISMSFSFATSSSELNKAMNYAYSQGVICVAAAGNDGEKIKVYPASINHVIGVASTSNSDTQSSFTNYGQQVVWIAAPGENVVSTYPFDNYASSSGTSFSTPLVAGVAALMVNANPSISPASAADALGHAKFISTNLNHGRLDAYLAVGTVTH